MVPLPLPAARLIPAGPWHKGLACVSIEDLALRSGGCCHSSCESCSTAYVRVLSSCVIVRFRAVYIERKQTKMGNLTSERK